MLIKKIRLENFCGFKDYEAELQPFTVFVGPNNGGKTTLLRAISFATDAFRMYFEGGDEPNLARIVNAGWGVDVKRSARQLAVDDFYQFYFSRSRHQPAIVSLVLPYGDRTVLLKATCMPNSEELRVELMDQSGRQLAGAGNQLNEDIVKHVYRVQSQLIPPLGTISPSENAMSWGQLQSQLSLGRYAETWRNQLHWFNDGQPPEVFQRVATVVREYLADVEMNPPRRTKEHDPPHVIVDYKEGSTRLDVAAAGGGLRTLVSLAATIELVSAPVLLFDEPDAHLHSSLQRRTAQLLAACAATGRQVIVSTHAPDFIDEVPPEGLQWVDRALEAARPCDDLGKTLVSLGAVSQCQAIQSLGADTVIYFEDTPDKAALTGLMERCGKGHLVKRMRAARLKGFGDVKHVPGALRVLRALLPMKVAVAAILDADYEHADPQAHIEERTDELLVLRLPCKELENLLILDGHTVANAAKRAAEARSHRTGEHSAYPDASELDDRIDEFSKAPDVLAAVKFEFAFRWLDEHGMNDPGDLKKAEKAFDALWSDAKWRRRCCSGKRVLAHIRRWLQGEPWKLTISNTRLFEAFQPDEDLMRMFDGLDEHITKTVGKSSGKNEPAPGA